MSTDRFLSDKATIRAELERRARGRRSITYSEAAALVGRSTAALAPLLVSIRIEEAARGRPDLGSLVVSVSTGLPGHTKPGAEARERAIAVQEAVFKAWAEPG